ncbi:hypothetical protein BJV82DRAFT_664501 [Fennellomyces sp. T-0311]|nr:hypothetical protein BJV82DRAFT_664501 [Fennellomyces sp. T-0311]
MLKIKEKWVGVHLNKLLHFGNTTTNRVEDSHANIKNILKRAHLIDDLGANKATLPSGIDMPISGAINDTVPGMSLLQKGSSILLQLEDHLHSGTDQERLQLINSLQSLIPTSGAPTIELKHPLPVLSSKGRPSTKHNKSA